MINLLFFTISTLMGNVLEARQLFCSSLGGESSLHVVIEHLMKKDHWQSRFQYRSGSFSDPSLVRFRMDFYSHSALLVSSLHGKDELEMGVDPNVVLSFLAEYSGLDQGVRWSLRVLPELDRDPLSSPFQNILPGQRQFDLRTMDVIEVQRGYPGYFKRLRAEYKTNKKILEMSCLLKADLTDRVLIYGDPTLAMNSNSGFKAKRNQAKIHLSSTKARSMSHSKSTRLSLGHQVKKDSVLVGSQSQNFMDARESFISAISVIRENHGIRDSSTVSSREEMQNLKLLIDILKDYSSAQFDSSLNKTGLSASELIQIYQKNFSERLDQDSVDAE